MTRLTVLTTAALCLFAATALAAGPEITPALLDKGKASFGTNCVPCHGEKGDGTGIAAAALNPKPRNFSTEAFKNGSKPDEVFKTLTVGLTGTAMAPFAHLPEEERWAVTAYVLKSFVKSPPPPVKKPGKKPGKIK